MIDDITKPNMSLSAAKDLMISSFDFETEIIEVIN